MTVTRTHTYPEGTPPGVITIRVSDGVNTAEAQVTILDSTPNTVTVNPASVVAGGTVSVTGEGYPLEASGTVRIEPAAGGEPIVTQAVTTDNTGKIVATNVVIPANAAPGSYNVIAEVGLSTGQTTLTVTAAPVPLPVPGNVRTSNITDTSVDVTWDAVTGANNYVVQYRPTGTTTWTQRPMAAATTQTVPGLTAGREYEFQVKAHDSTGAAADSAWSASVLATTTGGVPPLVYPDNIAVGTATDTTLPVTWTARTGAVGYVVQYRAQGTEQWTARPQVTTANDTITGLTAGTTYEIQVKAVGDGTTNSDSPFGPPTPVQGTTTGGATPLATPQNLAAGTATATTVPLTWDAVTDATAYHVQFKRDADATWSDYGTEPTTPQVTVSELVASTAYNFQVKALGDGTAHTDSPYTAPVNATTTAA